MKEQLQTLLKNEQITEFGIIPIKETKIIHLHLLPPNIQTAVMLLVPYDTCEKYTDGISSYAHVEDYHRYFSDLFERILPQLSKIYPNHTFYGFADHSPIAEKDAAAKAGLGFIGKHSLLIHPKYGSFVFLGSILTSAVIACDKHEVTDCGSCNACQSACPAHAIAENGIDVSRCLSALSQKKKLSESELQTLRESHIAWGCDICQNACPHNEHRSISEIPYFCEHRHGHFTAEDVNAMDDTTFSLFAFSRRGKSRIIENLQNLADQ